MDGVPFTAKEEFDIEGYKTTVGTSFMGESPATATATCVQRLLNAGAVLVGKTNMHEIGIGVTGLTPTTERLETPTISITIPGFLEWCRSRRRSGSRAHRHRRRRGRVHSNPSGSMRGCRTEANIWAGQRIWCSTAVLVGCAYRPLRCNRR